MAWYSEKHRDHHTLLYFTLLPFIHVVIPSKEEESASKQATAYSTLLGISLFIIPCPVTTVLIK
jgi:hypothetical protein